MYTEKQQSSTITVDQAQKTNSSQTKEVKPSHPPTLPLFNKVNSQSLQPLRWRDYRDNWISPKHNFMQHKRVLGCSQFTRCILCLKERPKEKKIRPVFLCFEKDLSFERFTLQVNLGDKSGGVQTSLLNIPFISVFIHVYDLKKTVLCLCACF